MANVHLNEKRINEILDRLLAHEATLVITTKAAWLVGDFPQKIYDAFHSVHDVKLIQQLESPWVVTNDKFSIYDGGPGPEYFYDHVTLPTALPLRNEIQTRYVEVDKFPQELQKEWKQLQRAYLAAKADYEEKREKHAAMFKKYKTLNALHKVWPSVLEFCAPDMVEQFNKPAERKTKEQIAELADELKNTVATARILRDVTK